MVQLKAISSCSVLRKDEEQIFIIFFCSYGLLNLVTIAFFSSILCPLNFIYIFLCYSTLTWIYFARVDYKYKDYCTVSKYHMFIFMYFVLFGLIFQSVILLWMLFLYGIALFLLFLNFLFSDFLFSHRNILFWISSIFHIQFLFFSFFICLSPELLIKLNNCSVVLVTLEKMKHHLGLSCLKLFMVSSGLSFALD